MKASDTDHPIIGIWSHDMLYSPGAAADEVLVFRPDGTGVLEIYNWTLCSYDTFTWQVGEGGTLSLRGQDFVEGPKTRSASTFSLSAVPFRIALEQTPVNGSIDVLHLRLPGHLPDRFGRTKTNIHTYTHPKFDGEAKPSGMRAVLESLKKTWSRHIHMR